MEENNTSLTVPEFIDKTEAPLFITKCKNCVFVVSNYHGQTGCELNRLEKFGEDKKLVKEENGFESWEIQRICNTFRPEHWAEMHHGENLPMLALKEQEIRCGIVVRQGSENLDNVAVTLKDIAKQTLKPKNVTLVVEKTEVPNSDILYLMISIFEKAKIPWNFERILDINTPDNRNTEYRIWDKGISRSPHHYTLLCEGGKRLPKYTLDKINKLMNYDLRKFLLIVPESKEVHKTVLQTKLWKIIGGFGTLGLVEKIEELNNEQNANMIVSWKELE